MYNYTAIMLDKTCRVCLNPGSLNIYKTVSDDSNLVSKLVYCLKFDICQDDGLPAYICASCNVELDICYTFITKCEESDRRLRDNKDNIVLNQLVKPEIGTDWVQDDPSNSASDIDSKYETDTITIKEEDKCTDNAVSPIVYKLSKRPYHRRKPLKKRSNEKITCSVCGIKCSSPSSLKAHKVVHSKERPFQCAYCDNTYKTKGTLSTHVNKTHMGKILVNKYICEHCGKEFTSNYGLKIHNRTHTGERPYECKICAMRFNQHASIIRHMFTHSKVRKFKCDQCDKSYKAKASLKIHQQLQHLSNPSYKCLSCNQMFKYKSSLRSHMERHLGKTFICDYCKKQFTIKVNLIKHIEARHSIQSGKCEICLKSVSNLSVHMRKHTGDRPLKCHLCPKSFAIRNALSHHINFKHKMPDKFSCTYIDCNDCFPSKPMLDFHVAKYHENREQFICDECPRKFFRKSDLARHKLGTHKNKL